MLALSPISALLGLLLGFVLSGALIALLRDKLPQDHGRAYAVDGQMTKGKARGSGVVFIPVFAAVSLLVTPFSWERCAYLFLTLAAMLTGYLDDRSDLPWGELKKGLLDLAICLLALVTFMNTHSDYGFTLFGWRVALPWWLFAPIGLFLLWAFINCCNCADGVDGHWASKGQTFVKVVLPAGVPHMMSALKISVGMSWVGVIVGEYLVSKSGLGYLIVYGGQVFKLDLVMASVVILCVLAALMYGAVALLEKRFRK